MASQTATLAASQTAAHGEHVGEKREQSTLTVGSRSVMSIKEEHLEEHWVRTKVLPALQVVSRKATPHAEHTRRRSRMEFANGLVDGLATVKCQQKQLALKNQQHERSCNTVGRFDGE